MHLCYASVQSRIGAIWISRGISIDRLFPTKSCGVLVHPLRKRFQRCRTVPDFACVIAISDNRSSRSQAASISRPKGGAGSDEKVSMTFIASRPFVFPPIPEVSAVPSHQTADGGGAIFVEAYVTNGIGKANETDEIDEAEVIREDLSLSDDPLPEVSPTAILSRDLARVSGWSRNNDALDEESPDDVRTTLQSLRGTDLMEKYSVSHTLLPVLGHGIDRSPGEVCRGEWSFAPTARGRGGC